ncbi:MAG TPA: extracellular solute-binding protein [Candidatus Paceibacterota bacterium]|jgi:ABC-type glycerol-3-phosphate transport system substrate-binding protein|nr:extracellular solute-binding protein [Candidatus Paceibacterota bacterium]
MKGNFQIIIMVVFLVAAVFGLLTFSGTIKIGKQTTSGSGGTVVIWGTAPSAPLSEALADFNNVNDQFTVKYVQKNPDTFDQDLVEALASGSGPDLIFMPEDLLYHYKDKIFTIPYTYFSQAQFNSTFVAASNVFLSQTGFYAFPLTVDPLMMYYNRSILNSNSIVTPPATWSDLTSLVPTLTQKDDNKQISQSAVALGQFANVDHAKDIIATLFMQNGNGIIGMVNGVYTPLLNDPDKAHDPSSALDFYLSFADPLSQVYSWNRSLPDARDYFSAENLAFYFGYASELSTLVNRNPNQDLLVAPVPQPTGSSAKLTLGHVTGIAVSAFSKNYDSAFTVANMMANGDFASKYAAAVGMPPARLDLLSAKQSDQYNPVFYSSALYARSWLDPSPADTDGIFRNMVEQVLSNNLDALGAVRDADSKLSLLLAAKK